MFEPPPDEPGRVRFGPLVSLLDRPSVLGVIVSVDRISVSAERIDLSEDCPPPQARLQHTRKIKRINPRAVEYIGARNELPSVTTDPIHDFMISAHAGFESRTYRRFYITRQDVSAAIQYLTSISSKRCKPNASILHQHHRCSKVLLKSKSPFGWRGSCYQFVINTRLVKLKQKPPDY